MIEKRMEYIEEAYSWAGYTYRLARELLGGSGFYAVREMTPMFCFYGETQTEVILKAHSAIMSYLELKPEPAKPEENNMQIIQILNPEDGSVHGHGVAVMASSMVAGEHPVSSLVAQYLAGRDTHCQCAAFIDGYEMRSNMESETE